jgi:uncharacterized membrane protein
MDWHMLHNTLEFIQHTISFIGILVIFIGVIISLLQYLRHLFISKTQDASQPIINAIRLSLGRTLILGLEFIVAADLIGTTTTPDYYAVGILASIVVIRTFLSFSINRELMAIPNEPVIQG